MITRLRVVESQWWLLGFGLPRPTSSIAVRGLGCLGFQLACEQWPWLFPLPYFPHTKPSCYQLTACVFHKWVLL